MQAQYSQQGRYGASVEVTQRDRPRNRVEVDIDVDEGTSTAITAIEIIGNNAFTDREIKRVFELTEGYSYLYLQTTTDIPSKNFRTDLENLSLSIKIEDICSSRSLHPKFL